MDFIYAFDRLRAGARLTRPSLYPNFLLISGERILLVEEDQKTTYEWIPGQEDLFAMDWYLANPPTQVARPVGFADSVVKGL